jgi:hypothetical protein
LLPCSLQKEQQEAACSLALYKKSNRERLSPSLFTNRATVSSSLPCSLQNKQKRELLHSLKEQTSKLLFHSFSTEGNPLCYYLYSLFVFYKNSKKSKWFFIVFFALKKNLSNLFPCSKQKEQQGATRSLAQDKKCNREWLTSLLFKKRATESSLLPCSLHTKNATERDSLYKKSKRANVQPWKMQLMRMLV